MEVAAKRVCEPATVSVVFVEHCNARRSAPTELRCEVGKRDSVEGIARYNAEDPARDAAEVRGSGARRDGGQSPVINGGGGQHSRRVHVTDDRRDGAGRDEVLRDFRRGGSVTFIIARNHPERVPIDSAGLVDLLHGELHALKILEPVALFPGSRRSDDVRRFVGGACRERDQRDGPNDFRRQLPPPLDFGDMFVPRIDEAPAYAVTHFRRAISRWLAEDCELTAEGVGPTAIADRRLTADWETNCELRTRGLTISSGGASLGKPGPLCTGV